MCSYIFGPNYASKQTLTRTDKNMQKQEPLTQIGKFET